MRNKIEWQSDTEFTFDSFKFKCVLSDYEQHKTTDSQLILLKDKKTIDHYLSALEGISIRNILEFGIFEGGSPVFLTSLFKPNKYVGIDLKMPVAGLDNFLEKHPIGKNIKIYYQISQDNEKEVLKIIKNEFNNAPIDLIIDDASHQYELTKRTFEIAFPLLEPGGLYCIEDWGWAHWKGFNIWQEKVALSNLIFELAMSCATSPHQISEVRIFPSFAFIKKSEAASKAVQISIDDLYTSRGKKLNLI